MALKPQAGSDVGENQRHIRGAECYAIGGKAQGGKSETWQKPEIRNQK